MYEYHNHGGGTVTMFSNGVRYVLRPDQTVRIDEEIDASMYGISRTKIEQNQTDEPLKAKKKQKTNKESE